MVEHSCALDQDERRLVEQTVTDHCRHRGWTLFAVNCRSNHIHVVVGANLLPQEVQRQLKAWCTRRLKERQALQQQSSEPGPVREKWWAERSSHRFINDEEALEQVIQYVQTAQDDPRQHGASTERGFSTSPIPLWSYSLTRRPDGFPLGLDCRRIITNPKRKRGIFNTMPLQGIFNNTKPGAGIFNNTKLQSGILNNMKPSSGILNNTNRQQGISARSGPRWRFGLVLTHDPMTSARTRQLVPMELAGPTNWPEHAAAT
jgi:REP element-mobilizing transposase RayT